MPIDREAAKELRRQFRDEVRDLVERFIRLGEDIHGESLKFWLQFDNVEHAMSNFAAFLIARGE